MGAGRGERRGPEAGIAQGERGPVAALVLHGRRGAAVDGGGGIDGVGGRACAVEALRDMAVVVYGGNDGGSAGGIAKRGARGQAVKGIGRVCRGADDLAQGNGDVGASLLDGRARGRLVEGRGRGIELDGGPNGWAHPGIGGRKRHGGLQVDGGGGLQWRADMSGRRHGTGCACCGRWVKDLSRAGRGR